MRFLVTKEMPAGVYRHGVGMFRPGAEFGLPDKASKPGEKPSALLEPLDAEADAALVAAHPDLAKAGKLRRFTETKIVPVDPVTTEPAPQIETPHVEEVTPEVPGGDEGSDLQPRRSRRR
jgi:hypothetical protein